MELSLAERRLLVALSDAGPVRSTELDGWSETELLAAADGPMRHGLVEVEEAEHAHHALTDAGKEAANGLPERIVRNFLDAHGATPMGSLRDALGPVVSLAIGPLKRKGWAVLDGGEVHPEGEAPLGEDEAALQALTSGAEPAAESIEPLRARGLVERRTQKHRIVQLTKKGRKVAKGLSVATDEVEVNQVTPELLAHWPDMDSASRAKHHLRAFDVGVDVQKRRPGKPHPLTQMMQEIRSIFWSMGFKEIAGDYVESAFWNMDALFIPQDHPARDMQDTFYLDSPDTLPVDEEALARGKEVHEAGGETGSTGWGGHFDQEVAKKALLRTHTTNTTVRYLADAYAGLSPADAEQAAHKVFGLGKVFRKETMDATHLPEFYQIEGIVTEPGASFDTLIGLARHFFTSMGFPEVRFRPAYFPYTEPSMEIDVKYNGRWMELGGSGVFRPEVCQPLGVPHPVLAWGFGLERLAMMRLGLKDIRDLYVSDMAWLQDTPLQ